VPQYKLWITSHGKASEKYWCTITKPVEVNRILLQWAEAWVLKNCTFIYVFLLSLMSDSCLSQAENMQFNVFNKTIYWIYSLNNLCLLSLSLTKKKFSHCYVNVIHMHIIAFCIHFSTIACCPYLTCSSLCNYTVTNAIICMWITLTWQWLKWMKYITMFFSLHSSLFLSVSNINFNLNLFSVHLIHRGYDPSDMELVNTETRLQISYMK
jgi:hypothetical protein